MDDERELREALAALAHEQWSGWMTYMLARFDVHHFSGDNELWGVQARWEELPRHAAQTRIRLPQAREERLERERGVG